MKPLFVLAVCTCLSITTAAQAVFFKNINNTTATNLNTGTGIEFNGYRYFYASKNFMEGTIWKTDGIPGNTVDFINSNDINSADVVFIHNNILYYNVTENGIPKSYKTDGNTKTLFLEPNADIFSANLNQTAIASVGNNIILSLTSSTVGQELYISDGTTNNLTLLKDIRPGTANSLPNNFTPISNNKIVFTANDGTNGIELWVTDGTTSGTQMVKDINPSGSSFISKLTSYNGKAYFALGNNIWETDGTEAGTQIFLNLRSDSSSEDPFYEFENELYFTANDASFTAVDLWKTDGTVVGSTILASGFNYADTFQRTNNYLFFAADTDASGYELWRTDGTPSGTFLTKDINPGPEDSLVSNPSLGNGGDKLFFEATYYNDDVNIENAQSGELWSSDGTPAGTLFNTTINPDGGQGEPDNFFNINNKLIFKANADGNGNGTNQGINLWVVNTNALSLQENKRVSKLSIYPNPGSSTIHIAGPKEAIKHIKLIDVNGKVLHSVTSNFSKVDTRTLLTGIYFLIINFNDGKTETLKFIKNY